MTKLKPCPFCGGKIRTKIGFKGLRFFVCDNCGCITSFNTDWLNRHPAEAEKTWNMRADMRGEKDSNVV